jgi:hypothetical protein
MTWWRRELEGWRQLDRGGRLMVIGCAIPFAWVLLDNLVLSW